MDVAHGGARKFLQAVGELDRAVAVRARAERVDRADDEDVLGLVQLGVRDVVRVHHADDELEPPPPVAAAVVPVQVLGLLQHAEVARRVGVARPLRRVAEREHRAAHDVVPRRVEAHLERRVRAVARRQPLAHVRLLLRRRRKGALPREDVRLLGRVDPRHAERHRVAGVGDVRRAQQRVHRRPRLPRQRRRRDDRHVEVAAEALNGAERAALLQLDPHVREQQPRRERDRQRRRRPLARQRRAALDARAHRRRRWSELQARLFFEAGGVGRQRRRRGRAAAGWPAYGPSVTGGGEQQERRGA